MRYLTTAVAAAALFGTPALLVGQEAGPEADSVPRYEVEGITVTARRTSAVRHDLPQKVDVATAADLDRAGAAELGEALKETLGLDVIQYPGLLSGVSIRGFRPQFSGNGARTLILIDGRPAGVTNLATLDPSAFQRVEVLKGPASALYGSSAMGGVVNLVSRSSHGALGGQVRGNYGSFGGYRAEASFGGSVSPALDFDLRVASGGREGGYRVGGSRLLGGDSVTKVLDSGGTVSLAEISPDSTISFSDYRTRSADLRVGYSPDDRWRATARVGRFTGEDIQNPGDLIAGWGQTLNDLERRSADLSLEGVLGDHALLARVFGSTEKTIYYDDPFDPGFVNTRIPVSTAGVQLQDAVTFDAHTLTFGLDHTLSRAGSERFEEAGVPAPPYAPDSEIGSTAVFAEAVATMLDHRLVATLGGRLDRVRFSVQEGEIWDFSSYAAVPVPANTEVRNVFNPSAGLLYRLGAGFAAHSSGGRAFVTPDPFRVAGYSEARLAGRSAVTITQGNPALRPESSVSWDAGVSLTRPGLGLDADLTFFRTDVRDRVVAAPVEVGGTRLTAGGDTIVGILSYHNADEAEIRGVEGRISYDFARTRSDWSLRLFANGTRLLRAEELSAGSRRRIRNVADLTVVAGLAFEVEPLGASLSGRYVGDRADTDFTDWMNPGEVRYPAFVVLDLSTRVRAHDRLLVTGSIDNLTDENYYEVRGYNLPGRSFRVGLSVEF